MKQYLLTCFYLLVFSGSFGQVDSTKVTKIAIEDSIRNPTILVFHSMGDVNVRGHDGNRLFVYAQEFLPSLSDLVNQNKDRVFTYLDKYSKQPIQVHQNGHFSIQHRDSIYKIETNVFSHNSNVFVMTPARSSVGVNIKDMGNIYIENVAGSVEANTKTGRISLVDVDGAVSASTIYGNIVGQFANQRVKPLFISTVIGNIEVIVPSTTKNTVLVSSEMGTLRSNFEEVNNISMTSKSNHIKNRKINFKLNGGGTEFVINTFKGDIYLRH